MRVLRASRRLEGAGGFGGQGAAGRERKVQKESPLEAKVLEDALPVDLLLHAHAGGGKHGEATVL